MAGRKEEFLVCRKTGKTIVITGQDRVTAFQKVEISRFHDSRHRMVVRFYKGMFYKDLICFFWMSSGLIYSDVFLYLTSEFNISYKQNSSSHLTENTEHCP